VKKSALFCAAVAAGVLVACAAQEGVRPKWTLQQANFEPIKPQTTKDEVERLVGKPLLTTTFPRKPEEVWDYRYMLGVDTYAASIHFDMQGSTTYTEFYPDRCPMRPVPCR
jgi:outer membrane protein assembly factor BamE (lipoprotein component of BamABCDE complex)